MSEEDDRLKRNHWDYNIDTRFYNADTEQEMFGISCRHTPGIGDLIVLHDYHDKDKTIQFVVISRTWMYPMPNSPFNADVEYWGDGMQASLNIYISLVEEGSPSNKSSVRTIQLA